MSIIRIRRGTTTQWNASTKILQAGELGLDTTLNKVKTGNGVGLWSTLPYINVLPSELTELAQDAVNDAITTGAGITKVYNDTANTITLAVDSTIANKTYVDTAVSGLGSTSATTYIPLSLLGNADGVAELDANGFVPDSQIPAGIARDTEITAAINSLINSAPGTLDTLGEIATALAADESAAAALTTLVNTKAPKADPTFTGTVSGITKNMVGLGSVDNTLDVSKPISTAQQTALDLKANLASPTFTGTVSGITKSMVGLGSVDNTADTEKPISTATQTALDLKNNNAITINSQTSNYTILLSDYNKLIEMSAGGTLTITDSVSFPVGFTCDILQTGASQVTIAGTSFTPNATPGLKLRTQWSSATLIKRALNSWVVLGDLSA